MTPLVMRAHRRRRHRRVQALGVRPEPADHVRELVRARRRAHARDATATSSRSSRRQRACRAFTDEPVDRRRRSRRCSTPRRYAPSAENRQPWEFVVVRDADDARRDRRAHPAGVGDARPRVLRDAARRRRLLADVDAGRDRRHRGRTGAHRRVRRHRTRPRGDGRRRRSSPRCRTCCSRRPRSGSAARSRRSPPASAPSCATLLALPDARRARSRSCRSATRRARSARRGASRSPTHTHREHYGAPW